MKQKAQALFLLIAASLLAPPAGSAQPTTSSIPARIGSDFRYMANNSVEDLADFASAPLHFGDALRNPTFYYTLLGAGAAIGTGFALDQTVRARIHHMSSHDAGLLESLGTAAAGGETGLLYLYGLAIDDERARDYAMTGAMSAGFASLVTLALKYGFGRLRPRQGHGAFRFFDHGQSFVSGETTPGFALAAAVSEYSGNKWYVMIPSYSAALTVGLGRMGHDAHWLSDVLGSAVVGIVMTEVLIRLHQSHAADPSRFRIFPVASAKQTGVGAEVRW
jgi:membrane-associated phospholipid phosphatase